MAPDLVSSASSTWREAALLVMTELERHDHNEEKLDQRTTDSESEIRALKVQVKILSGILLGAVGKIITDWIGTAGG